jgi:hypothetical protein
MVDRAFKSLVTFVSALALSVPTLVDAQRVDLPRPDSSRAPLLTRVPADSIRYQTTYLHVSELLQALQAGDAKTMSMLLENAALGSGPCSGVTEAVSRIASRARKITLSDGGTAMALFFDRIKIADSGATQVVTADLVVLPASSREPDRNAVTLTLDSELAVWTRQAGLLEALCEP